ncbi:MAG: peptidase MA family metallohydrolase [Candidatus Limnocylindrales bacterium]
MNRMIAVALLLGALLVAGTAGPATLAAGDSAAMPAATSVALPAATAPGIAFGAPSATAVLGQPLTFRNTFRTATRPTRVEALISTPYVPGTSVLDAAATQVADGSWRASVSEPDPGSVNTVYRFAFRVTLPGRSTVTGPAGSVTVVDPRFGWQAISGPTITLHWYGQSRSTAQGWLNAGESAVTRDEAAFGVTSVPHLDFFIYADSASFFGAIGAGANADAAGVYIADTHTAFGTVLPSDLGSSFPDQEIAHETTHHVFESATRNPYHPPPLWLDEGIAVYFSEGAGPRRPDLEQGIAAGRIVPLDGLTGAFPPATDAFVLSYAEAVSAVDFLLRSHGQAALQRLVRAYRQGSTDDQAFQAATGSDAAAFNAAWLASIGVRSVPTYGPRPAPAGPLPPDWRPSALPGLAAGVAPSPAPLAHATWRRGPARTAMSGIAPERLPA